MGVQREPFQILISVLLDKYLSFPRSHSKPTRRLPEEMQWTLSSLPRCRLWVAARGRQPPIPLPSADPHTVGSFGETKWSTKVLAPCLITVPHSSLSPVLQGAGSSRDHRPAPPSQAERFEEAALLALKMEAGDVTLRVPAACRSWEGQLLAFRISLRAFRGFPVKAYGERCRIRDLQRRRQSFRTRLDHARAFV